MISVDGDTSTNDMAIILANGESGNTLIEFEDEDYKIFQDALDFISTKLAKKIAGDGEGSTKLIEVQVVHAKTIDDAKKCARSISS